MREIEEVADRIMLLRYHDTRPGLPLRPATPAEIDEILPRFWLERDDLTESTVRVTFDACLSTQLFPQFAPLIRYAEEALMRAVMPDGRVVGYSGGHCLGGGFCQATADASPMTPDAARAIVATALRG